MGDIYTGIQEKRMTIRNLSATLPDTPSNSKTEKQETMSRLLEILQEHPDGMLTSELGERYGGLNRDVRVMMMSLFQQGKVTRKKEETFGVFCGRRGKRKEIRWRAV